MPACFSPTDDQYETKTGLYGVIGRVEDYRPEALFRASCGDLFLLLAAQNLFDNALARPRLRPALREPRGPRGDAAVTLKPSPLKVLDPTGTTIVLFGVGRESGATFSSSCAGSSTASRPSARMPASPLPSTSATRRRLLFSRSATGSPKA